MLMRIYWKHGEKEALAQRLRDMGLDPVPAQHMHHYYWMVDGSEAQNQDIQKFEESTIATIEAHDEERAGELMQARREEGP